MEIQTQIGGTPMNNNKKLGNNEKNGKKKIGEKKMQTAALTPWTGSLEDVRKSNGAGIINSNGANGSGIGGEKGKNGAAEAAQADGGANKKNGSGSNTTNEKTKGDVLGVKDR